MDVWNPTDTPPTLAGNDVVNSYTCSMGDYQLTMRGGTWGSTWHVDVRMTKPAGFPNFVMQVQRDPTNTRVRDGTTWVTIGTSNTYFFRANGRTNVSNLNIQYQLSNVTLADPLIHTGTYQVTITYTLVHNLNQSP